MPNLINKLIVRELTDAVGEAEGLVLVSMSGLTVQETEDLRNALAENGVRLRMLRNRLAKIAFKERGFEPPADLLVGNVACVWGDSEDAIHAAKVLQGSKARKEGKLSLRGGLLEGDVLTADEAVALAGLPGKDELRAKVLGTISAPAQSLVGLLAAPQGALARVIQARVDSQGDAEGDA